MNTKRLGTLLLLTTALLIPCLNPVAASNSDHPSMEDATVFLTDCGFAESETYSLLHNVPPEWFTIPEDSLWDETGELVFTFSSTNSSQVMAEWYDDETLMSEQWTVDWQYPLAPDGMEDATVFCEPVDEGIESQFEIVDEEPLLILNNSNSLNRLLAAYLMVEDEDVFFIQAEDDEFQEWKGQDADLYWLDDEDYVMVEDGDFDQIEALVLLSNTNEFQVVDANDGLNLTTWMNTTSAHALVYVLDVYDNEDEEFFTVLGLTPQYQPVNQTDEPLENTTDRSAEDDVQPETTVQPVEVDRPGSAGEWVATYGPAVAATTSVSLVALTFASSESLRYPISRRWWALLGLILATKKKTQNGDYQRGKIVGVISMNQGIYLSALVTSLGMGNNQAAHHLRILESEGVIWQRPDGRFVRFYTADIPRHLAPEELPTPEISLVEDSIPHRILMRLAEISEHNNKTVSGRWLSKSLQISQQLVSYHISVLVKHKLVTKQRQGLGNHIAITAKGLTMLASNGFHPTANQTHLLDQFGDQKVSTLNYK